MQFCKTGLEYSVDLDRQPKVQETLCELSVYRLSTNGESASLMERWRLQVTFPRQQHTQDGLSLLPATEVVFHCQLGSQQPALERFELNAVRAALDDEEKSRASRFHKLRDSQRYMLSHGVLRWTLARLLDVSPGQILYTKTVYGKPWLNPDLGGLNFNLSHSGDYFAIATSSEEVGVDIEVIRDVGDAEGIATHVFTHDEQAQLGGVAEGERLAKFFQLWVRKEAVLKAAGVGLYLADSTNVLESNVTVNVAGESQKSYLLWSSAIKNDWVIAVALRDKAWV